MSRPRGNTVPLNIPPKRGLSFYSYAWMDESHNPLKYTITKIAKGCVYYKTDYEKKARVYVDIDNFVSVVKDGKLF